MGVLFAASVGFGLAIGGIVAGLRARDNGGDFAEGFMDFIREDWAASVAISTVLFAVTMGVSAGVSGMGSIGVAKAAAAKKGGAVAGLPNAVKPASVKKLVKMMNKREGLIVKFAKGDELAYLRAMKAEGSHIIIDGKSHILLDKSKATRMTVFHEYMHHVLQYKKGIPALGNNQDMFIEAFLSRHSNFLRL